MKNLPDNPFRSGDMFKSKLKGLVTVSGVRGRIVLFESHGLSMTLKYSVERVY